MTRRFVRMLTVSLVGVWVGCSDPLPFDPGQRSSSGNSSSSGSGAGGSSSNATSTGALVGCQSSETDCSGTCVDLSTHPKNCGACGRDCLGGPCQEAMCQPVVVAAEQPEPTAIAVDASYVYWVNFGNSTVKKAPIEGGDPILMQQSLGGPIAMAVDATNVYWGTYINGHVYKLPLAGGSPTLLASDHE